MDLLKTRIYFIFFLFLIFGACSKSKEKAIVAKPVPEQPIEIREISFRKAVFTDPLKIKTVSSSTEIMDELIYCLDKAPKGSTVHLSIFLFNYDPLINAVKRAYLRGVIINAMIDYSREESFAENNKAIDGFRALFKSPSRVVIIQSDAGASSINHHKHALFSELQLPNGVAKKVVFSTSHNFTVSDTKKIQDAVVLTDSGLYDAFLSNWNEMASKAILGMKNFVYRTYQDPADSIRAYFFPRRQNGAWDGNDTVIEILDKISDYSNATVQVAMSDWVASRINTAKKLTVLQTKGVKVEVIAKDKADPEILAELEVLRSKGAYVKVLQMPVNNHSKFILIKGIWEGKQQEILINGTHNFTTNALRNNNEAMLIFKDHPLFKDYQEYYSRVKQTL